MKERTLRILEFNKIKDKLKNMQLPQAEKKWYIL